MDYITLFNNFLLDLRGVYENKFALGLLTLTAIFSFFCGRFSK